MNYKKSTSITAVLLLLVFCIFVILYERHIHHEAQAHIDKHARVIANALWNFNPQGASEYLSLACNSQNYEHAVVEDIDGILFLKATGEKRNQAEKILKTLYLLPSVQLSSDIFYKDKNIGRIEAVWNCTAIYKELSVLLVLILIFLIFQLYTRLLASNHLLEDRVLKRTSELSNLNKSLQLEIQRHQQSREALFESEERYRLMAENVADVIWTMDMNFNFTYISPSVYSQRGYSVQEAMSQTLEETIMPESLENALDIFNRKMKLAVSGHADGFKPIKFETQQRCKDGSMIWTIQNARFLPGPDNKPESIIGITHDITARKKSEKKIQQLSQFRESIIDNANIWLNVLDENGKIVVWNKAAESISGYAKEEVVGHEKVWEWVYPEKSYREKIFSRAMAIIEKDEVLQDFETTIQRKDGGKKIISWHSRSLKDNKGRPIGSIALGRDITERKLTEKALKESEDKYKELVQHAPTGIYEFDLEKLKFISVNDVMCEYTGYSKKEFLALDPFELLIGEDKEKFSQLFENIHTKNPQTLSAEYKMVGKNKEEFWVLVNSRFFYEDGVPKRSMGVVHNITERRRLELQLQQAHKMEAIGTLAGGIAHDFNNILAGILGYCSLLRNNIDKPEKVKDQAAQIFKGAQRAAELVSQILAFSRNVDYEKNSLLTGPIIKEVTKLLRSSIPATIEIKENIACRSKIYANPVKIHQIIMNLCTNAYHAMSDAGGTLSISLTDIRLFDPEARDLQVSKGDYVEIDITDTGHGMEREILDRIFDPYFTTKDFGKGTGMGLSMVYAIVKEHKGAVKVISTPGKGSCFKVYLPVIDNMEKDYASKGETTSESHIGNERIMIVDDEISILESTQELLSDCGYHVTGYSNGKKALEAIKKAPRNFDLVLTDMTMPGITGDILAKKIIDIRADLPIILCTGYNEKISEESALDIGITKFIQKPFIDKSISEVIREVLDSQID